MSNVFFNTITGSLPKVKTSDPYSQILMTLLYVILLCITYYPLFAGVDAPIPIVGHTIGAFSAVLLLIETIIRDNNLYSGCLTGCQIDQIAFAVKVASDAPILLLEGFLVIWFIWSIGYDIFLMIMPSKQLPAGYELLHDHSLKVRHRLSRHSNEGKSKANTLLRRLLFKIYPYDKGFKFPLRFLAGMIVAAVIIYQLALLAMYYATVLIVAFLKLKSDLHETVDKYENDLKSNGFTGSALNTVDTAVDIIGNGLVTFGCMLLASSIIGTFFCAIQFLLTFRNVSNHLHQSDRGDLSFLHNIHQSLQKSLLSSLRYPGYQMAYMVWAWLVYTLVFLLLAAMVIIAIILFVFGIFGPKIAVAIIGHIWVLGMYDLSQYFLVKYVFLQKAYSDTEHQVLDNRRLLHWFTYFFLFHNAFIGLFSILFRIILSLVAVLLSFSRLDKLWLLRGLENFDAAHRTYTGMIYLDYAQNNSILNVFCYLLLEEIRRKKQGKNGNTVVEEPSGCCQKLLQSRGSTFEFEELKRIRLEEEEMCTEARLRLSQRAYNRWKVAYTLIRNKQLIKFTGSSLIAKKKKSLRDQMNHLEEQCKEEPVFLIGDMEDLRLTRIENEKCWKKLLEKEELEEVTKKMLLGKSQPGGRDHKLEMLRAEVKRLQDMFLKKDEELIELNMKLKEHRNVSELKDVAIQCSSIAPATDACKIDVGVQFNYASLETDHLQGVTISSSKLFTVDGDQPQSLIWPGHGFELHFPANTCLPGKECDIMVDAVVGRDFVFPEGVEPVSAIYIISITSKLHMPSLLKIQHCVALDKASKHSRLSFYRALLKEPKPPYHFRRVKGGKFDTNSQFGELELPAFCSMGIGKDSPTSSEDESGIGSTRSNTSSSCSDLEQEDQILLEKKEIEGADNSIMYFGQVFYMKKELNEWEMKFIVVKHIEAFTTYVKNKLKQYEENVQVNIRFSTSHIELVLDREEAAKGWSIEPYSEPLVVSLKFARSFGYEKEVTVPPTCMVDVYGDNSTTDYVRRLHHPVFLKGALIGDGIQEPKIYIKRTMTEKDAQYPPSVSEGPSVQIQQNPASIDTVQGGASSQPVDAKAVILCIKEVFSGDFAELMTVVENSLQEVSAELFASHLITNGTKRKPSYEAIITDFLSGLAFKKTLPLIIQHCEKLFSVFYRLGGPFVDAGDSLKQSIIETVKEKLSFNLSFD